MISILGKFESETDGKGVGFETAPFPSFSRRGGCAINKKVPFLSGADGVVSKFRQQKVRFADIYKETTRLFTNHPGAARHPSLKTEGNGPVSQSSRPPRVGTCGTVLIITH